MFVTVFQVGMMALWPKCDLLSPSIFADADVSAVNAAAAAASAIAFTAAAARCAAATATLLKQLGVSLTVCVCRKVSRSCKMISWCSSAMRVFMTLCGTVN